MHALRDVNDFERAQENVDRLFGTFAHHRRRYALRGLRMHGGSMSLADLAEEVAIRENEATAEEIPAEEVTLVHRSLSQRHLPLLTEAGLVSHDEASGEVTLTASAEDVEEYQQLLTIE